MHYQISSKNPVSQLLEVTITVSAIDQDRLHLQLPSWRPGRYELGNFAKNILGFRAENTKGERLEFDKKTKDRWEINCKNESNVLIIYQYYGNVIDGGSTYVDERQWYINFINCLMYVEGRISEECTVTLECPKDYKIACGLVKKNEHTLISPDFYRLVDSPLIASADLQSYEYSVGEINFYLWFLGDVLPEKEKTVAAFEAFSRKQISMMGHFESPDYHFLFQLLPYKAYHGVEHFNSTTICLGPSEKINEPELYENFLGVSSHELFHFWNIIRIRPAEMYPYDFTKENYFKTGYVAEGFTTYYGDLFLCRSKVMTDEWYLKEMNKSLKRHFENFGRFNYSLAESSFDMWLDGYSAGIPNRKVSIYIKGSIVGMMLDLTLQLGSEGKYSLDDVIRTLYNDFYKQDKGYTERDIISICEKLYGDSLQWFFDQYIYGIAPVEDYLADILPKFGLQLVRKKALTTIESKFGIRVDEHNRVSKVNLLAPSYHSIRIDDELFSINGRRIEQNLQELIRTKNKIKIVLMRQNSMKEVVLESSSDSYFDYFEIVKLTSTGTEERNRYERWLS